MLRAARAAGVFAAMVAAGAAPQPPQDVSSYRQLVDHYRDRDTKADHSSTEPAGQHLARVVERVADTASGWTAMDLSAAAMMHTDACLRLLKRKPVRRPRAPQRRDDAARRSQRTRPRAFRLVRRWHVVVAT
jgi:hypothetical protein